MYLLLVCQPKSLGSGVVYMDFVCDWDSKAIELGWLMVRLESEARIHLRSMISSVPVNRR
jgi:hypothetical protein